MEEEKDGKLICEQIAGFEEAVEGKPLFKGRMYGGQYQTQRSQAAGQYQSVGQPQPVSQKQETVQNLSAIVTKLPTGVWIQFATALDYQSKEQKLFQAIADSDGNDQVVVFIKETKNFKTLPANWNVHWDEELKMNLSEIFGAENIRFRN